MSIAKIQRGDKVKVISGAFKGVTGPITKVVTTKKGKKASVRGVSKLTKFKKSFTHDGQTYPGNKTFVDRLLDMSNLAILDENNNVTKVGIKNENGKRFRFYKTTDSIIISKAKEIEPEKANEPDSSDQEIVENNNNEK
jgi:large subunit ribosomal protein L24